MKSDLSYISDGFYITLFANTPEGVEAYNEIAKHYNGVAKLPVQHLPSLKAQLKQANLTIRKQPKSKLKIEDILAQLDI